VVLGWLRLRRLPAVRPARDLMAGRSEHVRALTAAPGEGDATVAGSPGQAGQQAAGTGIVRSDGGLIFA